jgi:hypothetical protein
MHQIHKLIEGQLRRPRWQRILQSRLEPQVLASLRVDLQDAYNRFFVTPFSYLIAPRTDQTNHIGHIVFVSAYGASVRLCR